MGGTWSLVVVTLESAYVITVSYQLLIYKEDDAVVDDERLFLVLPVYKEDDVVACKYFFKLVTGIQ